MPAAGYYLGEALGLAALAYGLAWWLRRGERAVPAALAAAAALFAYAHFAGTPYQAAKAIVIASPLAMLIAARALLSGEPLVELGRLRGAVARRRGGATGVLARHQRALGLGLGVAFLGAAAGSSALALVNGPVGPATYSPALTRLRPELRPWLDPGAGVRSTCSPPSTVATISSGSFAADGSAWRPPARRLPRGRPLPGSRT